MIQTLIPAYRPPTSTQPLSSASIASREANPTVIEPNKAQESLAAEKTATKGVDTPVEDSPVYQDLRKQAQNTDQKNRELAEQLEIQGLAARDREVRAHERAHAAVGGQYASAPTYQYQRGPDGINYAIAGEVKISAGPVAGDPQATVEKAQVVRRAALAPAEPSAQDRQVAAQATKMEMQALAELAVLQQEERAVAVESLAHSPEQSADEVPDQPKSEPDAQAVQNLTDINLANRHLSESLERRIMSNEKVQGSSIGQLIDRVA